MVKRDFYRSRRTGYKLITKAMFIRLAASRKKGRLAEMHGWGALVKNTGKLKTIEIKCELKFFKVKGK